MPIALAFCGGLALGVVLGAALWSGALHLSRRMVEAAHRKDSALMRQEAIMQQKRIEKAKEQLRMQYGDSMTPEQERIMEQELGKLYKSFPNPQIPKGGGSKSHLT